MATSQTTRSTRRKPSQTTAKAKRQTAAVKRNTRAASKADKTPSTRKPAQTARKPRKASTANRKPATKRKASTAKGGGRALSDFGNDWKIRVVKKAEIPSRADCFKTGQTVSRNLEAQKAAGFFGRRKFLRTQIGAGRVTVSKTR